MAGVSSTINNNNNNNNNNNGDGSDAEEDTDRDAKQLAENYTKKFLVEINNFKVFHLLQPDEAKKLSGDQRTAALTDIESLYNNSDLVDRYQDLDDAITNAAGWENYDTDIKPFLQLDNARAYGDRFKQRGSNRSGRSRKPSNHDDDDNKRNRSRSRSRDINGNGISQRKLPYKRKLNNNSNNVNSIINPNNRYAFSDSDDDNNFDNRIPKKAPTKSFKDAISSHNDRLYFRNAKIAHVDFVGYATQYLISSMGASSTALKKHITIAASAAKFDNKLLTSVQSLDLSYSPLGPIFIAATYRLCLDKADKKDIPQIQAENQLTHHIYNQYIISLLPVSLNSELISVLNDKNINWNNLNSMLSSRLHELSKSPIHCIDGSFQPFSLLTCNKYYIFGSCKAYDKDPKSCLKQHKCIECDAKHDAGHCPKNEPWMFKKFAVLQGSQRPFTSSVRGRGYRNRGSYRYTYNYQRGQNYPRGAYGYVNYQRGGFSHRGGFGHRGGFSHRGKSGRGRGSFPTAPPNSLYPPMK